MTINSKAIVLPSNPCSLCHPGLAMTCGALISFEHTKLVFGCKGMQGYCELRVAISLTKNMSSNAAISM